MAKYRNVSGEICVALTMVDKNKVKKVKLPINPVTIPNGLFFPPVTELDNTIGRIGKIQGDNMVMMPPKNANRMSMIIFN